MALSKKLAKELANLISTIEYNAIKMRDLEKKHEGGMLPAYWYLCWSDKLHAERALFDMGIELPGCASRESLTNLIIEADKSYWEVKALESK